MAEALPAQLVVETTASALREKSKLRRHFRRFDMMFSHERMAYELSQIVPLAVMVVVGLIFSTLGRRTRENVATEPVTAAYAPANPAP